MDDHRQAICYFTPHNHSNDQRQATMINQQLSVLPHGHGHRLCESPLIPVDHMNSKPPVYVTLRRAYYHMSKITYYVPRANIMWSTSHNILTDN